MPRRPGNLNRAHTAISRVVERAARSGATGGPDGQAGPGSERVGLQVKRKRSRKDERKQARKDKKQRKAQGGKTKLPSHAQSPAESHNDEGRPQEGKSKKRRGRSVLEESIARAEAEAEAAAKAQEEAKRMESLMATGENAAFFKSLRQQRLISFGAGEDPEEELLGEDDRMIREMEKRLGLRSGGKNASNAMSREMKGAGMDYVLGYTDEAREDGGEEYAAATAAGSEEAVPEGEEGLPAELGDALDILAGLGESSSEEEGDGEEEGEGEGDVLDGDLEAALGALEGSESGEGSSGEEEDYGSAGGDFSDGDIGNSSEGEAEEAGSDPEATSLANKDVQYISRRDAYGDNKPGTVAVPTPGKYVPPALRARAAGGGGMDAKATKALKGHMNKLNLSNLSVIVKALEGLFRTYSRNVLSSAITTFVLEACLSSDRMLGHLLSVYAACVACLHHVIGMEVSAHIVQALATRFDELHRELAGKGDQAVGKDLAAVDKRCTNLLALFSYLYNFKVVHSSLILDYLESFTGSFTLMDVELLFDALKACLKRLRKDDTEATRALMQKIADRASSGRSTIPKGSRMHFLVGCIAELRTSKKKAGEAAVSLEPLTKAIGSVLKTTKAEREDPIRVRLRDLLDADTKGRWWLVGAAWAGHGDDSPAVTRARGVISSGAAGANAAADGRGADREHRLQELASQQRMNTDIRKRVFVALMSGEDYVDAFDRLLRLKLRGKQEREVVRVLVDCCLQEKNYNHYYSLVSEKVCKHTHNNRFTFQYTIWDRLKALSELTTAQSTNLMRLIAHLVASGALTLSVLKVVEFNSIPSDRVFPYQLLFVVLLTHNSAECVKETMGRLADNKQLSTLAASIAVFLKHYVKRASVGLGDGREHVVEADRPSLLRKRISLARTLLTRPTYSL